MISKIFLVTCLVGFVFACAASPPRLFLKDRDRYVEAGQIISGAAGAPTTFDEMLADLSGCRVVYVGEIHTDPAHHAIQLKILKALANVNPRVAVGMEMVDFTYQPVLDQWSAGELSQEAFLEKTHWYANWRFDFTHYRPILDVIREKGLPLFGLNIPFHIPPKVRIGGIDSLLGCDRQDLPPRIDTSNAAHRAYLETIFKAHAFHGEANFDFFYQAQCVWEDTMAASIARNLEDRLMVVLVGNGHIVQKFGIPERAFNLTGASYRTVYLAPVGETVDLSYGDYIWVTPPVANRRMP
ncbi:MAG: ChaN family lipoprotein [Desulfobacterales bacterium]